MIVVKRQILPIVVFALLTSTGQAAQPFRDCKDITAKPKETLRTIAQYAASEDVAPLIDQVRACETGSSANLFKESKLRSLQHQGAENEADFDLATLAYAAQYRNVDHDVDLYRRYVAANGLKPDEGQIRNLRKNGISEADSEKACAPVDLRKQLGPVRDQDDEGYCFAFATADLISAKLGKIVSAWDVDLSYRKKHDRSFLGLVKKKQSSFADSGGFVAGAFAQAKANGVCPESVLPSEYGQARSDAGAPGKGLSDMVQSIEKLSSYFKKNGAGSGDDSVCVETDGALNAIDARNWETLRQALKIDGLAQTLASASKQDSVYDVDARACDGKRIAIPASLKLASVSRGDDPGGCFKTIDRQLDAKNVLAMDYDADVLFDRHQISYGSNHASLIVGRRWNPDARTCEYLVRNSWGRGDPGYDNSYGKDQGNIWIPREILAQDLDEVFYLH